MSLAHEIAKLKAQNQAVGERRTDPALEAKLDRFVADNPKLAERYNAMSKEELLRKLIFTKMERAEIAVARNREVASWVNENPEIIAKVAQRLKKTVAGTRVVPSSVISASLSQKPW